MNEPVVFAILFRDWVSLGFHIVSVAACVAAWVLSMRARRRAARLEYLDQMIQLLKEYRVEASAREENRS